MAIPITPQFTPNSAYRPNEFITEQTYADPVEWAFVELTVNGTVLEPFPVPLYQESPVGTYQFRFDVQRFLQDAVAPFASAKTPVFGAFNAPFNGLVNECRVEYSVDVTYKYRDPATNLLVDLGVTDSSGTFYAIAATRQHTQAMDFSGYKPTAGTPSSINWLTNIGTSAKVSNSENLWLCHIADAAADTYRITTYTAAGVLLQQGIFAAFTSATETEIQSVGVGIANLATQVYSSGAVTLPNPAAAYYEIQLYNGALPFNNFIKPFRFNIVPDCEGSVRLHWFNLLSGADAYTFKKLQQKRTQASYTTAQKTLGWAQTLTPHNINDKGAYKLQTTAGQTYEADSDYLTPDQAEWLMELALSNEVYRETPQGLVPVVVTLTEIPVEREESGTIGLVIIRIAFTDANNLIVQHN
jgi:hypothetical protein